MSTQVGKFVKFESLAKNIQSLIEESISMREVAYCPYSKFQVGAALLTKKGIVYTGCNIENSAYGVTICAERTALVKAISSKERDFAAIAVSAEPNGASVAAAPCGECRQFISEFARNEDIEIYLTSPDKRTVFTGCNIENSAYGVSICAERTALVKAISSKERDFAAIAVSAEPTGENVAAPCGECRQFISEFARNGDIEIYLTSPDKSKILLTSIREILPISFHFE